MTRKHTETLHIVQLGNVWSYSYRSLHIFLLIPHRQFMVNFAQLQKRLHDCTLSSRLCLSTFMGFHFVLKVCALVEWLARSPDSEKAPIEILAGTVLVNWWFLCVHGGYVPLRQDGDLSRVFPNVAEHWLGQAPVTPKSVQWVKKRDGWMDISRVSFPFLHKMTCTAGCSSLFSNSLQVFLLLLTLILCILWLLFVLADVYVIFC